MEDFNILFIQKCRLGEGIASVDDADADFCDVFCGREVFFFGQKVNEVAEALVKVGFCDEGVVECVGVFLFFEVTFDILCFVLCEEGVFRGGGAGVYGEEHVLIVYV